MATTTLPLDIATIRRLAKQAIADRLGPHSTVAPGYCIIAITQAAPDGPVVLHVNSGNNAQACRSLFLSRGYQVGETGYDPFAKGHYGVQILVSRPTPREREFRAYETPGGDVTLYRRMEGEPDSAWQRVGEVRYDDLGSAGSVAERVGLGVLSAVELERLAAELRWPRRW